MVSSKSPNSKTEFITKKGMDKLKQKIADLEKDYSGLREKLLELNRSGDADKYELNEGRMHLEVLARDIAHHKQIMQNCKIVDENSPSTIVRIGSRVLLESEDGRRIYCMLVNHLEADPLEGKVSDRSPLGSALLGKMKNALIDVVAPRRKMSYRIVSLA